MSPERPNILWFSMEDTNPRFGCYGDEVAQTPNIDRLAAEGCRFPNAFSTSGVCAPSRSAIITGMYQTAIGTHHMRTTHTNAFSPNMPTPYSAVLPHYVKTFTEYLRGAGYYCTNNRKTDYQFTPPFTAWDELDGDAHWRNRPEGMPFFAVFNPTNTHESGMWAEKTPTVETDPNKVEIPPYLPDTPKTREALAKQYDNIARSDAALGDLLKQLEEDGLLENTIIFLWSDHGEGLPRGKRWPYDRGIRIPLIVRWPGKLEAGSVTDQLVSLVDLGPTVLSLCDVPRPAHLHGQPFLGPEKQEREYIFAARDRHDESYDMVRVTRDKRFKYMRNYYHQNPYLLWIPYRNKHAILEEMWTLHNEGKLEGPQNLMFQNPRPPEELYDTENDPWEINNLADDPEHQGTLERLRKTLDDWRTEFGDLGDMSEEQMVGLWYPTGEQPQTSPIVPIPICEGNLGREPALEGGTLKGPAKVQLFCGTQGASIGYTLEEKGDQWQLYTEPIALPEGNTTIRAKAIRIGYKEGDEISVTFSVT